MIRSFCVFVQFAISVSLNSMFVWQPLSFEINLEALVQSWNVIDRE